MTSLILRPWLVDLKRSQPAVTLSPSCSNRIMDKRTKHYVNELHFACLEREKEKMTVKADTRPRLQDQTNKIEKSQKGEAFCLLPSWSSKGEAWRRLTPKKNPKMKCSAKQILTLYHSTMGVGVPRMGQSNLTVSPNRNVCFDVTEPEMWGGPKFDIDKKK